MGSQLIISTVILVSKLIKISQRSLKFEKRECLEKHTVYIYLYYVLKVLYIKNLSKEATSEDLARLFSRYHVNDQSEVEYKLLQHGRMRGQAFVTFSGRLFFPFFDLTLRTTTLYIHNYILLLINK